MSSTKKKTPVTNARKKVTASAHARISVTRTKNSESDINGSYIQSGASKVVSNVQLSHPTQPDPMNQAILSMLQNMEASNKLLADRLDKVEQNRSFTSTPLNHQSHATVTQHHGYPPAVQPRSLTASSQQPLFQDHVEMAQPRQSPS